MFSKKLALIAVGFFSLCVSDVSGANSGRSVVIQDIYNQSVKVSGSTREMSKRALVALYLYQDSNRKFDFAYLVSHLTLAIDRSATNPRLEKTLHAVSRNYAVGWRRWGNGLKDINFEMMSRLHFAYFLSKYAYQRGLSVDQLLRSARGEGPRLYLADTKNLFESLYKVHRASDRNEELSLEVRDQLFEEFVYWEHALIIQPRIFGVFNQLPEALRFFVRNVPGRALELPITILTRQRTTLNLKCFGQRRFLRTKDFIEVGDRIDQARAFYNIIKGIGFDPSYSCYDDDYYKLKFPVDFHQDPEEFSIDYYSAISFLNTRRYPVNSYGLFSRRPFENRTKEWLYRQYSVVPIDEFASIPSHRIPVVRQDREALRMWNDAIVRNRYINRTYSEIGDRLSQCMGVPELGNWYHFAAWASKSGGDVIDGSKRDSLLQIQRDLLSAGENWDLTDYNRTISLFKRANNLIAIEMIPLGRYFVKTFCDGSFGSIENFINKIDTGKSRRHEQHIKVAFYNYYKAILENNIKNKYELVTLGATLQVIGEQIRVDDNLKAIFEYGGAIGLVRDIFRYSNTRNGTLIIGNNSEIVIPLTRNIETRGTHTHLESITDEEYIKQLQGYGLPLDIRRTRRYMGSRTINWSNLGRRIKFLVAMFRTYINREELRDRVAE